MEDKKLKRYFRLYRAFFIKNVKIAASFHFDFFFGLISGLFQQFVMIFFLNIMFQNVVNIGGWSYFESLFLYGFVMIPSGFADIFWGNIWKLPYNYIILGELDRALLRPVPVLFYLVSDATNLYGYFNVLTGMVVCGIAVWNLHLAVNPVLVLLGTLFLGFIGSLVIYAITLFVATFSFWVKNLTSFLVLVQSLQQFLRFPISLYNGALRLLLTVIVPYAWGIYYPVQILLGKVEIGFLFPVLFVVIFLVFLASAFFNKALKQYAGSGN